MTDRQKLLRKLQAADFALIDTVLYLDTHPADKDALDCYDKYQRVSDELRAEFTSRYGALENSDVNTGDYFEWVNNPWPWEMEA